jgi:hypothetical protein
VQRRHGPLTTAREHHALVKGALNSTGGRRQLEEAEEAETRRSAAATRRCVEHTRPRVRSTRRCVMGTRRRVEVGLTDGGRQIEAEETRSTVVWNVRCRSFQKWIDLTLKKSNIRTCGSDRIRGWRRWMGAAIRPEVEEKPVDPLNQDKSPGAKDKASEEGIRASEEARKGGGRRKREKRGKGEEEAVKITTSPSSAGRCREGDFRRENRENKLQ